MDYQNKLRTILQELKDDPCWDGYVAYGTKKKNGREVPNCVKENLKENYSSESKKLLKAINSFESKYEIRDFDELMKVKKEFVQFIKSKNIDINNEDYKMLSKIGGMNKILYLLKQDFAI